MADERAQLDVITIGRASVDLYGQQIGGRLEDIATFAKSVGGCPANIAIGCARLGLRSALVTRVGDEQMGRFIREQMAREGVDMRGILTDPERLTALVLLAVRDSETFPLLFYRENCADMALSEEDIDPGFVSSARAVLVTGTHFSTDQVAAASRKAMWVAREAGVRVVLDIDYRPNLWGLAGRDAGEERYIASDRVTATLASAVADCDLIVGTEEELRIAAGVADTLDAARRLRALSAAVIVVKRGPMGCVVFTGDIPDSLDRGIVGAGFPVEVYNVLGAGDAFMSGFLRGWLGGEELSTAATWANACGAFAVSRLLCSPEFPTWPELEHFLEHGSPERALRRDPALNHIHRATTRARRPNEILAFAFDHRSQFEKLADRLGAPREKIAAFKTLALEAVVEVASGQNGYGLLCDETYGREALFRAEAHDLWIARPVEKPASRPLRFEAGRDLAGRLNEWPVDHVAKCFCTYHPEDPTGLKAEQEERLMQVAEAASATGRELLIEIVAGQHGPLGDDTVARVLSRLYACGLHPEWWKLEPQENPAAWAAIDAAIDAGDPSCRGVLLLGLESSPASLEQAFQTAGSSKRVCGFAIGRTIFAEAAENWLGGRIDDAAAVRTMAERFRGLVAAWRKVFPRGADARREIV